MRFYLMHCDRPVAAIQVAEKTGDIIDLEEIFAPEHIPYGARNTHGSFDVLSLRKWWAERGIPASRSGVAKALELLDLPYPEILLVKCNGLSLSDQYWVTPADHPQKWHAVNFFENDFSEDVGRALFGESVLSAQPDLCSPCNTSDGFLQKRWRIAEGKRVLLKAGSGIYEQEPYNEVVASRLFALLGLPHVPYWLTKQGGLTLSACECFVDQNTEYVSAAHIMRSMPQGRENSNWEHFRDCCARLKIPGAERFTANMLAADSILANTDRHLGNFGALRNPQTLEWVGVAPIFDSGTSLWQMTVSHAIDPEAMIPAKPFETTQQSQLRLAAPFVELPLAALDGFADTCCEILAEDANFDAGRAEKIAMAVERRIEMTQETLEQIQSQAPEMRL